VNDTAAQYRAELDFEITFSNGGGLRGEGFRIDITGPGLTEDQLGAALVADLGLLMAARVEIRRSRILSERHKRAAPPSRGAPAPDQPGCATRLGVPVQRGAAAGRRVRHVPGPGLRDVGGSAMRRLGRPHPDHTSVSPLTCCSCASRKRLRSIPPP
jgi:arylformamidase